MAPPPLPFLIKPGHERRCGPLLRCLTEGGDKERIEVIHRLGPGPFVLPLRVMWNGSKPESFDFQTLIPKAVARAIREGNGVLLLDGCDEGRRAEPLRLSQLHEALRQVGIPFQKALLITQNRHFPAQLAQWQRESGLTETFQCGYYHVFLRYLIDHVARDIIPSGEFERRRNMVVHQVEKGLLREKHYLCLNFTPRLHRIATMLHLLRRDLLDRGLVSFSGLQNWKLDLREDAEVKLPRLVFPEMAQLVPWLPRLREHGPFYLDTDPMDGKSPVTNVGQFWYYEQTCFSLVTETDIDSKDSRRFTEKSFKPMMGLHPFLILGVAHTLHDIKALGFRTFDNFIDSSYDSMEDTVERLSAVLAEFERLCRLPLEEWAQLHRQMLPDLLHNYDYFANGLKARFIADIEIPLFVQLRQIAMAPVEPGA